MKIIFCGNTKKELDNGGRWPDIRTALLKDKIR